MKNVEYRPAVGYPGYLVGSDGSVIGKRGAKLKMQSLHGYWYASLLNDGVLKSVKAACLVAAAFIGERPSKHDVCHNNGIRSDDRVENLRYDTRKNNQLDRVKHGTTKYGEASSLAKLTNKDVIAIRKLAGKYSVREIGRRFGVTNSHVCKIINRKNWKHVP